MIDPETAALGAAAAKVLNDVASPALKQVGESLRLIVERVMGPLNDRLRRPVEVTDQLLEKVLGRLAERGVTPEGIRKPAEEIVAQVVFSNLIAGGQPEIEEMFADLLTTELDSSRPATIPVFAEVIRQLSAVDARVIKHMSTRVFSEALDVRKLTVAGFPEMVTSTYGPSKDLKQFFPESAWKAPSPSDREWTPFTLSLANLKRLDLADVEDQGNPHLEPLYPVLALTLFGRAFCSACVAWGARSVPVEEVTPEPGGGAVARAKGPET